MLKGLHGLAPGCSPGSRGPGSAPESNFSTTRLREKCKHLALGIQWCGHQRAFHFLISKSLKLSQLFQLSAASKPLKCVERNAGCYSSFLIFVCINPICHWLNFGFCCKIWEIGNMNLFKNMSLFCELSVQANINHKLKLATNLRVLIKHCSTFC